MADMNLGNLYMTDSEDSVTGDGTAVVGWIEVTNGLYSIYNAAGTLVAEEQP
jgi:hypothetical protein